MLLKRRCQAPTGSDTSGASPDAGRQGPEGQSMLQELDKPETVATRVMGASFKDGVVTSDPDSGDELTLIVCSCFTENNQVL